MFGPDPEVAEMKAVIAPEDHDGIVSQTESLKRVGHPPNLGVDVAGAGVVSVDEFAGQFVGDLRAVVLVGNREVVADFPAALLSHLG